MARFPFLLGLLFTGVFAGMAQTPLLQDPTLLELESILSEYGDVTTGRLEVELADGPTVLLEIDYAELPQTTVRAFAYAGGVVLTGYVEQAWIDPAAFLRSEEAAADELWSYEMDGDGDLAYTTAFTPDSREDLETRALGLIVLLQLVLDPHLVPMEAEPQEEVEFDIAACARGIEGELVGMPQVFADEADPWAFCTCLAARAEVDPGVLAAMMNPLSPEGQALIGSCWDDYIPRWRELGITPEMAFAGLDPGQVAKDMERTFTRGCVREIMDDPELATADLTYGKAESYCACLYREMQAIEGLSFSDFQDLSGDVVVELGAACVDELGVGSPGGWNEGKSAIGCSSEQRIPLLWDGSAYQIRLTIGGIARYMTLDTGASEVIIHRTWFREIQEAAEASGAALTYKGAEFMQMANGAKARVEQYEVSTLAIGDCTFFNFSIGVMDEGGMLCGMGLLGLFDAWTLDTRNSELVLSN